MISNKMVIKRCYVISIFFFSRGCCNCLSLKTRGSERMRKLPLKYRYCIFRPRGGVLSG